MSTATGRLNFTAPHSVEMTATITMQVRAWRDLRDTLEHTEFAKTSSGWDLVHGLLKNLLSKVDKEIWATESAPGVAE